MQGGALFGVSNYAQKLVTGDMAALQLHKDSVGGYAYNNATMLCKQIDRGME